MKDPARVRDFILAAREAGRQVVADRGATVPADADDGARRATDLFDWQDDT